MERSDRLRPIGGSRETAKEKMRMKKLWNAQVAGDRRGRGDLPLGGGGSLGGHWAATTDGAEVERTAAGRRTQAYGGSRSATGDRARRAGCEPSGGHAGRRREDAAERQQALMEELREEMTPADQALYDQLTRDARRAA